jgi:hypothetical protein
MTDIMSALAQVSHRDLRHRLARLAAPARIAEGRSLGAGGAVRVHPGSSRLELGLEVRKGESQRVWCRVVRARPGAKRGEDATEPRGAEAEAVLLQTSAKRAGCGRRIDG